MKWKLKKLKKIFISYNELTDEQINKILNDIDIIIEEVYKQTKEEFLFNLKMHKFDKDTITNLKKQKRENDALFAEWMNQALDRIIESYNNYKIRL